jgi:hypothetical protein
MNNFAEIHVPDYETVVPEWCNGCVFAMRAVKRAKETSPKMDRSSASVVELEFGEAIFIGCNGLQRVDRHDRAVPSAGTCAVPKLECTNSTPAEIAFNWRPSSVRPEV